MSLLLWIAYWLGGLALVAAHFLLFYTVFTWLVLMEPASNSPRRLRPGKRSSPDSRRLIALGDSLTHGNMSDDWLRRVPDLLPGHPVEVLNAGVNGDLTTNLLRRLSEIIAADPSHITLLIGSNNILCGLSPTLARNYRLSKGIRKAPGIEDYREDLHRLIRSLREGCSAQIAVLSLPPIGERLETLANATVGAYCEVIRTVAAAEGCEYLPLNEALLAVLAGEPQPDTLIPFRVALWPKLRPWLRYLWLGQSWDEVSAHEGYVLMTDGIHLNARAGQLAAGLVADWLARSEE